MARTPKARTSKLSTSTARTRSRVFDVDCKLAYTLPDRTHFVFLIHALDGMDQAVLSESLRLSPAVESHTYEDPFVGHRFLRVHAPAGKFSLRYKARVQLSRPPPPSRAEEQPIEQLPDEVLHNLMPTRYCESDLLAPAAYKLFGDWPPGISRVSAICDWIYRNVDYRPGSSDSTTTARDVFLRRAGVCRDFAHLGITFCRALNIPARLAVGYTAFGEPPPDFHAIFEAYVGDRWHLFDATRMADPRELIRIAVGRDAKDVAFATIFGAAQTRTILPLVTRVE